jgi:hypothetical protein
MSLSHIGCAQRRCLLTCLLSIQVDCLHTTEMKVENCSILLTNPEIDQSVRTLPCINQYRRISE